MLKNVGSVLVTLYRSSTKKLVVFLICNARLKIRAISDKRSLPKFLSDVYTGCPTKFHLPMQIVPYSRLFCIIDEFILIMFFSCK